MRTMSKAAKVEQYDGVSAELSLYRKAMQDLVIAGHDAPSLKLGAYRVTVVGCWRMDRGGSPMVVVTFAPGEQRPCVEAHDAAKWHDDTCRAASSAIGGSDDPVYRAEWEQLRRLADWVRNTVNAAFPHFIG